MRVRERVRPALRAVLDGLGLAGIPDLLRHPSWRTLKRDARSHVGLVGPLGGGTSLVAKTYRELPHLRWRTIGRPSAARREYVALRRIRRAGIPAVEPLGWHETRRLGIVGSSVLVTRHLACEDLREAIARGDGRSPRGEPLAEIAASMVEAIRRLHEAGISVGTLFDKNVLLPLDPADPQRFYLCDTPSVRTWGSRVSGSARRHDFACMAKWWRRILAPADVASLLLSAWGGRSITRAFLRDAGRILARVDRLENRTAVARLSTRLSRLVRKSIGGEPERVSRNPKYLRGAGAGSKGGA